MEESHAQEVNRLQEGLRAIYAQKSGPVALHYGHGHSNTTRPKSYKQGCPTLDCGSLNRILCIDVERKIARVEPRVTMDQLAKALLPFGLIAPVIPEFKGITVGGAIMGAAAESSSHHFGIFSDTCLSYELLLGDGSRTCITKETNSALFHALPGSYGSLGMLVSVDISLIEAQSSVHLEYTPCSAKEVIGKLRALLESPRVPLFLDALVLDSEQALIIEGRLGASVNPKKPWKWFVQDTQTLEMTLYDYLFRYDKGAFWMGAYLYYPGLLARFFGEGVLRIGESGGFSKEQQKRYHQLKFPSFLMQTLTAPFMHSQRLWCLLHKAEKWVQDRFIIQDFCLPASTADTFLQEVIQDSAVFPLWICPIKATQDPQLFAPHATQETHCINIGVYGLPLADSISSLTKKLEDQTKALGGRKVLYSHSYYSPEEFWRIYPEADYKKLREETHAEGMWRCITEKVLSI